MSPLFKLKRKVNIPSSFNFSDTEEKPDKQKCDTKLLTKDFTVNIDILKKEFNYPLNSDLYIRNVYISSLKATGILFCIGVISNLKTLEEHILAPLLENCNEINKDNAIDDIMIKILTIKQSKKSSDVSLIVDDILNGHTALIIDGYDEAILMSAEGIEHRSVERPSNENVLKGPKEAFIESSVVNRSLIRKQIRNKNLITESIVVGELSPSDISLMYMKNIVDDRIVERVKKRITQIKVDTIQNTEMLEQHIEERPYSLVPTVLYTERADRAVSYILEGHVALIMDNSPAALILPVTFWTFFHTGEEQYQRWAYGNFIRLIRAIAFIVSFLTPSLYIAATNYHQDMLPSDLLLAIAGTRETIPLPVIAEVLLMEISFELIREASTRIPATIGPTIGIVGALILGQAAVEANIVSPILVIIVALTGLASFAIPEISFSYLIRIGKFIGIFFSSILGLFGLSGFLIGFTAYLISIKSFGVPFLAPLAPHYSSSRDIIMRPPVWKEFIRPFNLSTKNKIKKKPPKGGLK
ncbi:spore germination protein [Clostridium bovifaecis]|uniref:Spore germination protein n=1 Tax=Clostridium bovifaecis TaxID=2184719 RepID=A0A6I6EQY9_9CLOT|nr:spore germination protein [Clostridium bovifaecis]